MAHILIVFGAKYLIAIPIILLIYIWAINNPHTRWLIFMRVVVGGIVAYALTKLGSHYVIETRPYLAQGIQALISNPPRDNSFPSDHTTVSFFVSLLILPFSLPLGLASLAIATLIALSRVLAHVHNPIDLLGGIVIALIAAAVACLLFPGERTPKA